MEIKLNRTEMKHHITCICLECCKQQANLYPRTNKENELMAKSLTRIRKRSLN